MNERASLHPDLLSPPRLIVDASGHSHVVTTHSQALATAVNNLRSAAATVCGQGETIVEQGDTATSRPPPVAS